MGIEETQASILANALEEMLKAFPPPRTGSAVSVWNSSLEILDAYRDSTCPRPHHLLFQGEKCPSCKGVQ